jgi:hypothetical protein
VASFSRKAFHAVMMLSAGGVTEDGKSSKARRRAPESWEALNFEGRPRRRQRHLGLDDSGFRANAVALARIECIQSADFDERLQSGDAGQEQGDDNQMIVAPAATARAVALHTDNAQGWVPEQLHSTRSRHQERDVAAASGSAPIWRGRPSISPEPLNPGSSHVSKPPDQQSPKRGTGSASHHKKWQAQDSPSEGNAATLSGAMPQVTEVHGAFPPHEEIPASRVTGYQPCSDLRGSHSAESAGRQLPQVLNPSQLPPV